jgi:hypothetical protein
MSTAGAGRSSERQARIPSLSQARGIMDKDRRLKHSNSDVAWGLLQDSNEFDHLFDIIDTNQDGVVDQYEAFKAIRESATLSKSHSTWVDLEIALRGALDPLQSEQRRMTWTRNQFRQFCAGALQGDYHVEATDESPTRSRSPTKVQQEREKRVTQRQRKVDRKQKEKMISELDDMELSELLASKLRYYMLKNDLPKEALMQSLRAREINSSSLDGHDRRTSFLRRYQSTMQGAVLASEMKPAERETHSYNFAREHFTIDDLIYIFEAILNCTPQMARIESLFHFVFQLDYQVTFGRDQ